MDDRDLSMVPDLSLLPFDEETIDVQLEPKKEFFIQEYLIDLNIGKTALRVGISAQTAYEWIRNPSIAARIRQAQAQRLVRIGITQDRVLQEMAMLSHSRINHYLVDDDGQITLTPDAPKDAMAAVQSVKRRVKTVTNTKTGETTTTIDVEIKLWDKPTPLKLMGRHVGLFPDRMELTGKDGGPIELTPVSADELRERALKIAALVGALPDDKGIG